LQSKGLSTGLKEMDRLLGGLKPGDNIVWLVPSMDEYKLFLEPFISHAKECKFTLIYVSIDSSLTDIIGRDVETFHISEYNQISSLIKDIKTLIEEKGRGTHYVFDPLTLFKNRWGEDALVEFFLSVCPYLFEMETTAYFSMYKGAQKNETIAKIKETTQILVDVSRVGGEVYIQVQKAWDRYADEMFKPHKFRMGALKVLEEIDVSNYVLKLEEKVRELNIIKNKLKESEEKYRDLYDNAPDMYHSLDENGVIIECNETEARMLGYSKDEIIGRPLTDFFTDESKKLFHKDFPKLKKEGSLLNLEREFVRKDGTTFPVSLNVYAEFDENGRFIKTRSIARDITVLKEAEKKLKKLAHDLGERVKELNCLYAISKLVEREGSTLEDILQDTVNLIPPAWQYPEITCARITFGDSVYKTTNFRETRWKQAAEIFSDGKRVGKIEVCYLEERPEIDEGPFLKEERNLINAIAERLGEIIFHKTAEKELRRLKEFNEGIVKRMEEGIIVEDREGFITFTNPRMLKMLGGSRSNIVGRHWSEIFSPESIKKVEEENLKLMEGMISRYEAVLDFNGKKVDVMVSATPISEDGRYSGNIKVFVDITERKKVEERLRLKALKYNIEKGSSYLITEKALNKGLDVFLDLLNAGYKGLIISRTEPGEMVEKAEGKADVIWLSKKIKGENILPPLLSVLAKFVEDFVSSNRVLLLDRLEYLIVQNGFNEVMKFLQELNEVVYVAKSILIVVVDPSTLSAQELGLLEKEMKKVEAKYQVELDKDLFEILMFVKSENESGRFPAHKDVAHSFGITRPTAIKRIKELKNRGYIVDRRRGKFKIIELTERGKAIL